MSALTQVILGLDRLSPAELETVAALVAARTGTLPASSPEPMAPATGSVRPTVPLCVPLAAGECIPSVDEAEVVPCGLVENPQFRALMRACEALSGSTPSGQGRKAWITERIHALKSRWHEMPIGLRSRMTRA